MELSIIITTDEEWGINNTLQSFAVKDKFIGNLISDKTIITTKQIFESAILNDYTTFSTIIVVDSNPDKYLKGECFVADSVKNAVDMAMPFSSTKVVVFGDVDLTDRFLLEYHFTNVYLTKVSGDFNCDLKLSNKTIDYLKHISKNNVFSIKHRLDQSLIFYTRTHIICSHQEQQYLNLLKDAVQCSLRPNRTGISTYSCFGKSISFNLEDNKVVLLDTKRVAWKSVLVELLWFLSGQTSTTLLKKYNVKIWDGNTSRIFLDSTGKHHIETGDIGEGYGWQWRSMGKGWGGRTGTADQISYVVNLLKTDPYSRRMIISAWNPLSLPNCALPPCHILCQLYVREDKGKTLLDMQVYQRSADLFLGVPFNLASYSVLNHILCRLGSTQSRLYFPGKLFFTFGDAHIYKTHLTQVAEQLSRVPNRLFPTLSIDKSVSTVEDLYSDDELNVTAFNLSNYHPQSSIKAQMVV